MTDGQTVTNKAGAENQSQLESTTATNCEGQSFPGCWRAMLQSKRGTILLCCFLFVAVVCVFAPAIQGNFLFWFGDDPAYVTDNPYVKGGLSWQNIRWAFSSTDRANWFPITWLSYMLDRDLYGLNSWGYHLTNVLLHGCNAVLLFLALRSMTGAMWRSLAVTALFAFHPLRVESVAWVAERKDVLSTFFWLLTLLVYARYVRLRESGGNTKLLYVFALFSFACGLMSKAMLVTLPCALLLLDYWPLQRFSRKTFVKLLVEKAPFFALVAGVSVVTYTSQKKGGFVETLEQYSLSGRVENAIVSYVRYLGKMLWPEKLCHFYQHPGHWPITTVSVCLALLLLISAAAFFSLRRWPYVVVGWFWYLGTLVPVVGLVQLGDQAIANRFVYIPMIGFLLLIIWGACDLTRRWRYQAQAIGLGVSVAVAACIVDTRQQIHYFHDDIALWQHDVQIAGKYGLAHYILGLALHGNGRTAEALEVLRDIVKVKPEWSEVQNNLGGILAQKGLTDEAIVHYEAALKLHPEYVLAHFNLANALRLKGKTNEALVQYGEAIKYGPEMLEAHYKFAQALLACGKQNEAAEELKATLRLNSNHPEALHDLGLVLLEQGRTDDAAICFQQAAAISPASSEAQFQYAAALGRQGRFEEAIDRYRATLRLSPYRSDAHYNVAVLLLKTKHFDEAVQEFQKTLDLKPDSAQVHNDLGVAFYQRRQIDEAIVQFEAALKVDAGYDDARKNLEAARAVKAKRRL